MRVRIRSGSVAVRSPTDSGGYLAIHPAPPSVCPSLIILFPTTVFQRLIPGSGTPGPGHAQVPAHRSPRLALYANLRRALSAPGGGATGSEGTCGRPALCPSSEPLPPGQCERVQWSKCVSRRAEVCTASFEWRSGWDEFEGPRVLLTRESCVYEVCSPRIVSLRGYASTVCVQRVYVQGCESEGVFEGFSRVVFLRGLCVRKVSVLVGLHVSGVMSEGVCVIAERLCVQRACY